MVLTSSQLEVFSLGEGSFSGQSSSSGVALCSVREVLECRSDIVVKQFCFTGGVLAGSSVGA